MEHEHNSRINRYRSTGNSNTYIWLKMEIGGNVGIIRPGPFRKTVEILR